MRAGFLGILIVFLATVGYVAWHLWRLTPGGWAAKWGIALLFLLWMAAAFAGMGLGSKASIPTITALYEIGHPWMIAYLYLLIAFVLADMGVPVGRPRKPFMPLAPEQGEMLAQVLAENLEN